jgi:hypothetical protein
MTCQENHDCQVLLQRARQIEAILKLLRERHLGRRRWITSLRRVREQKKKLMDYNHCQAQTGKACRLGLRA